MVPPNEIDTVIDAYSHALIRVFILSAALNACTILVFSWSSGGIKKGNNQAMKKTAPEAEKGVEVEK